MTVLIVDDHGSFRTAARKLLEHHGYRVVGEACDGESALAAVRELRPDVVLLDVQMPGIDGFEVASRLNAIGKPPEVVFVSSRPRKLSEIQGDDSMILTLARGHYCRKEHQQHLELAANYPGSSCTASTTATGSGGARRSPISGTTTRCRSRDPSRLGPQHARAARGLGRGPATRVDRAADRRRHGFGPQRACRSAPDVDGDPGLRLELGLAPRNDVGLPLPRSRAPRGRRAPRS